MKFEITKEQIEKVLGPALMEAPFKLASPAVLLLGKLPIIKESVDDAGAEEQSKVTTSSGQGE